MRICLNMRLAIPDKMEGIGWYSFEITKRLVAQHPEHEFYLIYDRKIPDFDFHKLDNVKAFKLFPPARRPFLWKYWFNKSVTKFLQAEACDLFLSYDGYLSLNSDVPQISVIHDLNFEHYPEDLPASYSRYYLENFPRFAARARRVVTVSQFSKEDIIHHYNVPGENIDVVYNGVKPDFQEIEEVDKTATRNKYSSGSDYILYVGSINPRKNLPRLCQAYDQFRKSHESDCKLILAGSTMWDDKLTEIIDSLEYKSDIIHTGNVSLSELVKLMGSASMLSYVSYFEGFGVPIIEAFATGTPVICSNRSSLPEIAGEAALKVDPFKVDEIASALLDLYSKKELKEKLISAGRIELKRFSWYKSASKMWEVILKAAE